MHPTRGEELVADINTPETMDVDVETLMGLIRRRAYGLPDAQYIMSEVERARLRAAGVVTCKIGDAEPSATGGNPAPGGSKRWKLRLKSRVAGLILRIVRAHFSYQRLFNNSVVRVLQLMADDLYAYEQRLGLTGRPGEDVGAPTIGFDLAAYEEEYLDPKPLRRRSLSLFRELLREGDVVLELLCGRGELLAEFAANGIEAVGVDPDAGRVSECRERGLRALHSDIFGHLRNSPDATYGGIFAGRVVERLRTDQIAELLSLASKKLRRGGIFVASATNIDHLPALRKFYMDPSLVRPVPARLLGFMVERSGLRIHHFTFSGTVENLDEEMSEPVLLREVYPYDEYMVVAVNE